MAWKKKRFSIEENIDIIDENPIERKEAIKNSVC